jgi:hypothetical protein
MELINILSQLVIFTLFFSIGFPVNKAKFNSANSQIFFSEQLIFNIIVQINLLLILSFLNFSLKIIFSIYLLYLFIFLIYFFNRNLIKLSISLENKHLYHFAIFLGLVIFIDIAYSLTLEWDSQKFWIYKTLNFYDNGTIQSLNNLPPGDGANYPYLGSLLWSLFWKFSFISDEYAGRLLYGFLYVVSLLAFTEKLKTSLVYKIVFLIILICLSYQYRYFGGDQDILIFILVSFLSVIVHGIYKTLPQKISNIQVLSLILICNALIWTKPEGSIYSFIMIFIIISFFKIELIKKFYLFFSVLFLFILQLAIFKFYNLNVGINSCCWNDFSINSIILKLSFERLLIIFQYFFYGLLMNFFFMFGLICLFFSFFIKNLIKDNFYIYFFILINFSFIFTAYILSDLDLVFMLKNGVDRLIYGTSPIYLLIFVELFNSQKFRN